jgi:hypothetical protein
MAATRLSDSQKSELVERFRAGAGSQELAEAFGCSPNTVSRLVKAALEPEEYERLKQQRGRRPAAGGAASQPLAQASTPSQGELPLASEPVLAPVATDPPEEDEDGPAVLAIDDADDFSGEEEDDLLDDEENGDGEPGDGDGAVDHGTFLPIPVALALDDHMVPQPMPLASARLPASAYMLVDKTVELQARPLSDFPELGRLSNEEQCRQALVVYANPRQAKRVCGRTQRVIKIPDPRILERTAPYLLAQGISRVVIEGTLYALPGS